MTDNSDKNPHQEPNIGMGEKILSRRLVLKRALTFGCGLVLPIVLIGCDSKQSDGSASSTATPSGTTDRGSNSAASTSGTMTETDYDSPTASSGTADSATNSPAAQSDTPGAGTEPEPASTAAGKVSQASVRYQDTPNGNQKCDGCVLFVEPNACSVVEGVIAPEGWCSIWAPKAA